jgi:LuxR family transcriptional regulator, maltose regulon positive regulatory protein
LNQSAGIPLFRPWITSGWAHLWLAQGNLTQAADWAEHTLYHQDALEYPLRPVLASYAHTVLAAFASEQHQEVTAKTIPFVSTPLSHTPSQAAPALPEPLTLREQEVLHLLAQGASNQEIARQLVVSLATVKKHVANILSKLEAENRTQAVAYARSLSLL